jgi:DNA repair exonuclease SbcCD ATPase subunit
MENTVSIDVLLALFDEISQENKEKFKELDKQMQEFKDDLSELEAIFTEAESLQKFLSEKKSKHTEEEPEESLKDLLASSKALDKQMDAYKRIGKLIGLRSRVGVIAEHLCAPDVIEKFKQFGINLNATIVDHKFLEPEKGVIVEADMFLSGNKYAVVIKAKAKPTIKDIDEHVEQIKTLQAYAERCNDPRRYLGAIAGMTVPMNVKEYAFKQGFLILLPSGDSISIESLMGFIPK